MEEKSTKKIRGTYNKIAWLFDLVESPLERRKFAAWRRMLHREVVGPQVLEAGAGTGKNLAYYRQGLHYTAIDLSSAMLEKAQEKADREKIPVNLVEMDIQDLKLPDNHFDTVFATFVFCSVPNPVTGLSELRRVCKPGGKLLLLEHVRPKDEFKGRIFDLINPLTASLMGENINRQIIKYLTIAGWRIEEIEDLAKGVVYFFVARP